MWPAWDQPGKGRLEVWWEQRSLWFRGVLLACALGGIQLAWMLDQGLAWWEQIVLVGYVCIYPFVYVRGKLHPQPEQPMDPEKKLRMRMLGSWGVGLSLGLLLAYVGAVSGPGSLLLGVMSGVALGTAVGWLIWSVSR